MIAVCNMNRKTVVITTAVVIAIFLLAIALFITNQDGVEDSTAYSSIRLPKNLKPIHYSIRVQPFIGGNFSINGFVEITFDVLEETDTIILHINDIITRNETAKVHDANGAAEPQTQISSMKYDRERQFLIVHLKQQLKKGKAYVLSMDYIGYMNDRLTGLHRSSYKDENGVERWLAVSQLAAIEARKFFPCFDEPNFKANFTLQVVRMENLTAVSNAPISNSKPMPNLPGWILDTFETSYPMSTYLVALLVSNFVPKMADTNNYKLRVWARNSVATYVNYSLAIGPKILSFYEEFYGVPFPLSKMDMAAVPDYLFGGMENWGLIFYRESKMLYDPVSTKAEDKEKIGLLISHELAHQWFGNLVSPKWWSDIWLNEGFASFVAYSGLHSIEPTMQIHEQFVIKELHKAFQADAVQSSHPIRLPVDHPNEINEIFDDITYKKGASVIRMMAYFLTSEILSKGLSNYLTQLSFANAEQDDLWEYLSRAAREENALPPSVTVKDIMDTWTLQMGYPVVTVKRIGGEVILRQERYLSDKTSVVTDSHDYKWWIPITFKSSSNYTVSQSQWMKPSETEKTFADIPSMDDWFIFNLEQAGYYRVNYDNEIWHAIAEQLLLHDHTIIHQVNRAQLIDDSFNLAKSGYASYTYALEMLSYLYKEKDYTPISAASENMIFIEKMFVLSKEVDTLKSYVHAVIVPLYHEMGFEDSLSDPHVDQLKRSTIMSWACRTDYAPCLHEATRLFGLFQNDPANESVISPNLKKTVFCAAIADGDEREWNFAWNLYEQSNIPAEKSLILEALACSQEELTLRNYLALTLRADGGIRKHDVETVIQAVSNNNIGQEILWQFIQEGWYDLAEYFGSSLFVLPRIIEASTRYLKTEDHFKQLQEFKSNNKGRFLSAQRAVEQAEEIVKNNIKWMKVSFHEIVKVLTEDGFQFSFEKRKNSSKECSNNRCNNFFWLHN